MFCHFLSTILIVSNVLQLSYAVRFNGVELSELNKSGKTWYPKTVDSSKDFILTTQGPNITLRFESVKESALDEMAAVYQKMDQAPPALSSKNLVIEDSDQPLYIEGVLHATQSMFLKAPSLESASSFLKTGERIILQEDRQDFHNALFKTSSLILKPFTEEASFFESIVITPRRLNGELSPILLTGRLKMHETPAQSTLLIVGAETIDITFF